MPIKFDKILNKIRENDAFSGSYNDLQDLPTLGTAAALNYGTSENNLPILDAQGKLNINVLPGVALTDTFVVANEAAMLALTAQTGDVAVRSDVNKTFILKGTSASTIGDWQELLTPTDSVHSVFGRQGTVTAQTNDYTWAQIDKTTSSIADITTRSYNDLQNLPTLGTLAAQNGTFSGGGTLATGGYTLTVPATGTAALLGTANTFTATQIVVVDQGNAEFQAFTYRDTPSAGFFRANKARGTLASPTVLQDGDLIGGFIGNGYTGAVFSASAQISLVADGAMGSNRIPGRIELLTSDGTAGATARMTIKNNGNVGIGTASPSYKLEVNGTFKANTTTPVFGAHTLTIPATGTAALLGTANTFTAAQTINGNLVVDTNTLFVDAANNRVGVNTASPLFGLHFVQTGASGEASAVLGGSLADKTLMVQADGAAFIAARDVTNDIEFASGTSSLGTVFFGSFTAHDVQIRTQNINRVIVSATRGKVGINTTSPSAQLHVEQTSSVAAEPVLRLRQAHLTEEFIRFDTTVGAGNPINTTALGTYYGRVRVWVEGVGVKWLALYNT